jgi:hypothetical protein
MNTSTYVGLTYTGKVNGTIYILENIYIVLYVIYIKEYVIYLQVSNCILLQKELAAYSVFLFSFYI